MKILFLTLSSAISDLNNRGIYPDLLRHFASEGHEVYIMCPYERRTGRNTCLKSKDNVHTLGVRTLNVTKSSIVEKGIGMLMLEKQYMAAWKKYFSDIPFDLILYSTPPITFNKVITKVKSNTDAICYLLLKDIFPQNALDIQLMSVWNPFYWYFRSKEKILYSISDYIGCMSPANVDYILSNNPRIDSSKIEVCPNSIDLKVDRQILKWDIRVKYNIPKSAIILVYGGNLGKPQGIDFLLKVLESNISNKDVFFIIAGNGTEESKIKAFCDRNIDSNVLFLGHLGKDEFDIMVMNSDIGLIFLDNRYTIPNFPSRLLTYMEYKLPILLATDTSTDVGKIVEENKFGFFVLSVDPTQFNKRMQVLVSDEQLRKEMGNTAYKYLVNHYTVEKSYSIIMNHFN